MAAALYSSGHLYSREQILAAFRSASHTPRSQALLDAIDARAVIVVCSARLAGAGRATRERIVVNRTMYLDDILATLVHEGQHYLDMASAAVPVPAQATLEERLLAEARAHSEAARFAALNNLTAAHAYRHAQLLPEVLLESIIQSAYYIIHLRTE